ncbi:MAG: hypothetical protein JXA64_05240 [Candidatus Fermentibacteraceae bacterium]|nr:hypothetical protein [Candidatus Fermentibacteraceae bacterium]MBN2608500.1 hypothetical protein [Candidatus Fermentibacteraceae bacterium]
MQYFMEEKGKYVYRSSAGVLRRKILTWVIYISILLPLLIVAAFLFILKESGEDFNFVLIPVVLAIMIPSDAMILMFMRRRMEGMGTVVLDYVQGLLTFNRGGSVMGRMQVRTGEIAGLEVSGNDPSGNALLVNGGIYRVRLVTSGGESHDVMWLQNREEALAAAGELASILSVRVRDLA